ncbi:DUF4367 domain-containing protein [Brevibacillus borstelensis]|uniref:DUF4367 domain-containing protein n=1 Tax=Brevibacillus borstelensis TaxID=45462 RepID=UPI0030BD5EC2
MKIHICGSYLTKLLMALCFMITSIFFSDVRINATGVSESQNDAERELRQIRKKVDFQILLPENASQKWGLEIKTYPQGVTDKIKKIRLHYLDENNENLMIGIGQSKAYPNESVELPHGTKVMINGNLGYFSEWGGPTINQKKVPIGGLLWVQNGTFIELNSSSLSKDEMIKIANSMK